ncbi:hypothetical protein SeLEV6574_g03034 [Synchytrium endobioticum]|uniref:Uncharacterized protein n=1 Tax=Synchytrium endobioticum TaxID=286115 RepID=A0A507D5L9_9FUNG|nr:hypothetical protein SeLEV6574_g03034 [Synchytrium endobioticum]
MASSTQKSATIPGHLGDLMSATETFLSLPDLFTPLQRVLLTANGNVQRIISSYYNAPVTVDILLNHKESSTPACTTFKRSVNIIVKNHVCCRAVSTVHIYNVEVLRLVEQDCVGIGQLFRYLNILPEFTLVDVGRDDGVAGDVGGFWRHYILSGNGFKCHIHERFPDNVFNL